MKQVTYHIRGMVTETMIPAIMTSASSVAGVKRVQLSPVSETDTVLTLVLTTDPSEAQEASLASVMNAKGLELLLDTRTVEDVADEASPATSSDAPSVPDPNLQQTDGAKHYVASPPPKKGKQISLTSAVASVITAVALAVLVTFSLTTAYRKSDTPPTADVGQGNVEKDLFDELEFLDRLFRSLTVTELGEDFSATVLKAYVAATGDIYAEYFTDEELESLESEQNGEMCGIGMTVVNGTCTVGGIDYQSIVIANVYQDSPAERAGVLPGDCIMYVGTGDDAVMVHEIGYTEAMNRLTGTEGTICAFTVFRLDHDTETYETLEFSAVRQKMTTRSVNGRVYDLDPTVGVIKITGFDHTTRDQFSETVEALKEEGCTSFVLDLRGNPGGLLTSVEDVLVYFLQEGDTIISVKDNTGYETVTKLGVDENGTVTCGTGQMKASDVGKYRDLNFTVLVNGYSASAAELFTANMRDHGLAQIVGTQTFGKGSMQSTVSLSRYGYKGALKLTTAYYYPPSGEGYHGIGITPDVVVELSEEVQNMNINLLTDEQDNQLAEAVKVLKPVA